MKRKIKPIIILFIIFFISNIIYANPFFSKNQNPKNQEFEESSIENIDNDLNTAAQQSSPTPTNPKKNPRPVLVGPTNPKITNAQGTLREKIATFFKSWETAQGTEKNKILWGLIITSFLYGIIHAAGPGHRKTVVFSLYIARKSPWYEPLFTGIILALLHGGCAIILMLIFKGVSGSISANTNLLSIYMEGFTYGLLIILALFMIIKETIDFIKSRKNNTSTKLELKDAKKIKLIPFLLSGIYPCPGAILILVLSFTLNILWAGIIAVIFMSLGMALLIIIVAYLAWFGRKGLFITLKNHKNAVSKVSFVIEVGSYLFLLLFSLYVSLPFFKSIF